jgi:dCMP deaminase
MTSSEHSYDDDTKSVILRDELRPSLDKVFMDIAVVFSDRSTCLRIKTGCVIVRDGRIISTGYNGSAPGAPHCCDIWRLWYEKHFNLHRKLKKNSKDDVKVADTAVVKCFNKTPEAGFRDFIKTDYFYKEHGKHSILYEIHAEMNAILYAAKMGVKLDDTVMYTVYSPCNTCAKSIKMAGISRVYYKQKYDRDTAGIEFLNTHDVPCTEYGE